MSLIPKRPRLSLTMLALAMLLWAGAAAAHDDREPREREVPETHEGRDGSPGEDTRGERSGHDDSEARGEDSRSGSGSDSHGSRHSGDSSGSGRHGAESRGAREPRLEFERDAHGHERLRDEVLLIGGPREVVAARAAGYQLIDEADLGSIGEKLVRLRVRQGSTVEAALRELAVLAPDASVSAHHLFRPAEAAPSGAVGGAPASADPTVALTIGIIDTGVDTSPPELRSALREKRAFASGGYVPRAHGTLVAAIAASGGARLASADVFGLDADEHPAAPAAAIARAVDWLVVDGVRVLNISIEGPDNLVLAHVIRRVVASGVAILAPAGNDGPAAAPVFPAAYPGVIAVTAVDARGRVYRRANRGAHVAFAARGVDVTAARLPRQSGTSFAAPLVSAALAARWNGRPAAPLAQLIDELRGNARDLGAAGRDDTFGWGEIALPEKLSADSR